MPLIPQQNPPYYTTDDTNTSTKIYTALLTQTGTSAPTATVLKSTLSGTLVWTRFATGEYIATLTGEFPTANKIAILTGGGQGYTVFIGGERSSADTLYFPVAGQDGILADDLLTNATIQITIYP